MGYIYSHGASYERNYSSKFTIIDIRNANLGEGCAVIRRTVAKNYSKFIYKESETISPVKKRKAEAYLNFQMLLLTVSL